MAKMQALQLRVPSSPKTEPLPLMREMPPADPFPTDALGYVLRNAATGIHDRTRAPIAIPWSICPRSRHFGYSSICRRCASNRTDQTAVELLRDRRG